MKHPGSFLIRAWHFYRDGFANLSWWGRRVWIIILIKLFIIFIILKLFFFHNFLGSKFESDREKSEYVMDKLTNPPLLNDR
jgi:hypothetical protein